MERCGLWEKCLQRATLEGRNQPYKVNLWRTAIDCGTPAANLLIVKLLFNSVVSTPGAKFLGLDLKDFYLNTPMDRPEFLRIKLDNFPHDVIRLYNLMGKVDAKGFIILRIHKSMYGLP